MVEAFGFILVVLAVRVGVVATVALDSLNLTGATSRWAFARSTWCCSNFCHLVKLGKPIFQRFSFNFRHWCYIFLRPTPPFQYWLSGPFMDWVSRLLNFRVVVRLRWPYLTRLGCLEAMTGASASYLASCRWLYCTGRRRWCRWWRG